MSIAWQRYGRIEITRGVRLGGGGQDLGTVLPAGETAREREGEQLGSRRTQFT